MQVEVVENRRKRRRKMSALQASYFGGGSRHANRRHRRRRNPDLMSLGMNPRRRHRRRRNPSYQEPHRRSGRSGLAGMTGGIGKMFDFKSMLWVGTGIFTSKGVPAIVQRKLWSGMPTTGVAGYAVRVGVTFAVSELVRMLTKSRQNAQYVITGGMAAIAYDVIAENIAPMIGLSGLGGLGQDDYVTEEELKDVLGGYVAVPVGYAPTAYFDEQNLGGYVPAFDGTY